jgi:hypothetical protein
MHPINIISYVAIFSGPHEMVLNSHIIVHLSCYSVFWYYINKIFVDKEMVDSHCIKHNSPGIININSTKAGCFIISIKEMNQKIIFFNSGIHFWCVQYYESEEQRKC